MRDTIHYADSADPTESRAVGYVMLYNGSGADIVAKNAVSIDETVTTFGIGTSIKTAATAEPQMICGMAMDAIPTGTWGRVQVSGIMVDANVVTATAAKSLLVGSATTAGRLIVQAGAHAATELVVARSLTVAASNLATIEVLTAYMFAQ